MVKQSGNAFVGVINAIIIEVIALIVFVSIYVMWG